MEIEQKIAWLRPERIQKLYEGQKSSYGMNRLFVIGIGKNGIDCVLRCMHNTSRRFGLDPKKVRFLCIGIENQLNDASYEGTVPSDGDVLQIVPEDAIYKYLNNPAKLPDCALSWFDQGLKNYSPATPTYGLTKRQCGRVALFHYIKQIVKMAGSVMNDFGSADKPLDIILTGNLGDPMFGGMFIDLAYILNRIFAVYPGAVRVNAYLFAADTAALIEEDNRDLGFYSANTIIAKNELDKFQLGKKYFSQQYSKTFSVDSNKPPFNACFLIPAAENYDLTMSDASEKILNRMEIIFSKDDDAERILSYNMLKADASHDFRYLACNSRVVEAPVGKMMSYLSIKLFTRLNHTLNGNNVGEVLLKRYSSMVSPSRELVASKSGSLPSIEFDERSEPAFSAKSVRNSSDNPLSAVQKWLSSMKDAVVNGGPICAQEIADSIITDCENAKTDFARGPFYAQEILRKCFAEIRINIAKVKSETEDMTEQTARTRVLERAAYRKVHSSLFVNKAVEQYLFELKGFAESSVVVECSEPMIAFYHLLNDKLTEYYNTTLQKAVAPFEQMSMNRGGVIDSIKEDYSGSSCVSEAFSLDNDDIRAKLDAMADSVPKDKLEKYFSESGILSLPDDDETAFAKAVVKILRQCFEEQLSMPLGEMCAYFGVENGIESAMETCVTGCGVTAPVSDKLFITRVICPKNVRQEDIARLRKQYHGVNYIWNGSVCSQMTAASTICGGAQLEEFSGYQQWENMHYAYANDSLKKHGLKIFA